MRVLPIGLETSRLLLTQWSLLHTSRILRFGIAQSLLVVRLRYRNGYLFNPVSRPGLLLLPSVLPYAAAPPTGIEEIKPLDLIWPSEIEEDEVIVVVEQPEEKPIPLPGSIVDLLT